MTFESLVHRNERTIVPGVCSAATWVVCHPRAWRNLIGDLDVEEFL